MNPQIRFGEDLMSRVSYAMMHPEGAGEMTTAVRKALDGLIASLAMRAGIKRVEILELALVGNPIMHHLLLGIDPTPLGGAPFALATDRAVRTTAAELGLLTHPGARVYVLPCIAGHVGADTAGVILAEEPHEAERMTLVVDVGTNAEIVLGDGAASSPPRARPVPPSRAPRSRAASAPRRVPSSASGSTARRSSRASGSSAWTPGRTSRPSRRASPRPASPASAARASSRSSPRCSWRASSPRTASSTADWRHGRRGSCPTAGRSATSSTRATAAGHGGRPRIAITQNDVRAIQLAKAALYAGVRLLMDQLAIDELDEIRLAGAFGSQIDPVHAMILGLIPDCDLAHVRSAGNAAGTGALIALLSGAARREIEGVVRRVEKIETAVEPRFQQHFVEAMAFPHKTAAFPNLAAVVALPERQVRRGRREAADARTERRRRAPGRDRHEGGRLMDDPQRRRSGGRAARQALRLAAHAEHVPFLTRKLAPFEVLGEEGLALIEHNADTILEEVGVEFRGDAEALRLLADAGADVDGVARPLPARDVPPDRPGDRAAPVHPVRPQPGAQRRDRRDAHGLRPELRLARSCATSTAAGATARSRTSATS